MLKAHVETKGNPAFSNSSSNAILGFTSESNPEGGMQQHPVKNCKTSPNDGAAFSS